MVVVCNFLSSAAMGELVETRCAGVAASLAALPDDEALLALADSRPLHATLFAGLAPPAWPDAAGTWRGTPGSSIASAPRAVFLARRLPGLRHRDICLPPEQVLPAMLRLRDDMHRLWHDRSGSSQPWRDGAFDLLAGLTARFFSIHPYMDGNGHVWRLTLPVLARRLGLQTRAEWTAHRRPYGPEFSLALQWHADHPSILAAELRRWFRPDTAPRDTA